MAPGSSVTRWPRRPSTRGHDVTLLHRHQTTELPGATHLLADRDGDLSVLDGQRWDATIDVCAYVPAQVRRLHEALGRPGRPPPLRVHRVGLPGAGVAPAPTRTPPCSPSRPEGAEEVTNETYGPAQGRLRARSPREAYGDDGLALIRPTYVVGPRDATARYPWWPLRAARGGPMIAPGPLEAPMQCIDARDMGAWTVRLAEGRVAGVFTAARPWTTFGAAARRDARRRPAQDERRAALVPVDGDWLVEQGVDGMQLPLWTEGGAEWSLAMATSRAEDAGLTHRPFADVVRDTLAWAQANPDQATNDQWGLSPERERELLDRLGVPGMTGLAHRLDGIPPTIFTTMSALALRTGAVNLGQGFPDADGPASVLDAARDAIAAGANQYAPGNGVAGAPAGDRPPPAASLRARPRPRHPGAW